MQAPRTYADRADTRESIIAAARTMIAREGLPAFSARGVAQESGVSVGLVYKIFGSLDGLVTAANLPTLQALGHAIRAADRPGVPLEERLIGLADGYIAFAEEYGFLWRALFEHSVPAAAPEITALLPGLFAVLEEALCQNGVPPDACATTARALWSGVHGIVYLGLTGGLGPVGPESVREMTGILVTASARGLLRAGGIP